jgi:aspartyl/asparaginyl beta-hydroxylase (cupin superfamily)
VVVDVAVTPQLWFADDSAPFLGQEPYFYDTGDFSWVARVESQWTVIRDELLANLAADDSAMQPYVNREMVSRANSWKTLGLMFWTIRSERNCAQFPRTWEILKDIPNITAASLNVLEPQTTIKPHVGNTNAIIRCHLGLVVPEPAPRCAFRVGAETRSWDEGKFLMFCDAHQHTAWNNTDRKRYILVVDVMRPEFMHLKKSTSSRVLAAIYHEAAYQRIGWLKRWFGGPRGQRFTFAIVRAFYRMTLSSRRSFSNASG